MDMSTTYYDRLQAVSELALDESSEKKQYDEMTQMISTFNKVVTSVTELVGQGLQGAAGAAITKVLSDISKDVQGTLAGPVATGWAQNEASLQSMRDAGSQFQNLSTQLVSPKFWNYVMAAGMVIVPGVGPMEASQYLQNVKSANNKKREEAAYQILSQMHGAVKTAESRIQGIPGKPVEWPSGDALQSGSDSSSQSAPVSPVSVPGLPSGGLGGVPSGSVPGFDPSLGGGIPSGGVPGGVPGSPDMSFPPPGLGIDAGTGFGPDSGLPSTEWDWSIAPVIVPNGPAGGIVPPPVVNQFDPSWKTGFSTGPSGSMSYGGTTGSLSGTTGWAGAGGYDDGGYAGYGAGGAGGYGAGGVGGLGAGKTGGYGAGSIGGYGAGGAGGYGAGSMGAGPGGAPGSGGLGGAGRLGSSTGSGLGQAGADGAAGGAGAAKGSGGMVGSGAGGGSSKDEKLKRRKYKVMRFRADRDPEDWGELPPGAGPGRAEDLPARRPPDEEDYPW